MPKPGYKKTEIGIIPEEWEDMDRFVKAVQCFVVNEKFLLKNNLNERTMTHKLAEYLQKEYCEYHVDCEYNRMPDKSSESYIKKSLPIDTKKKKISWDDTTGATVFPDIIIHKRGTNKNNFIVIEAKKKVNISSRDMDFIKLRAFTSPLGLRYKYGVYIEFDEQGELYMKFFEGGKEYGEK